MLKKLILVIAFIGLIMGGKYIYEVHLNYNFKEISEGKVYKSGVIPPEKIKSYVDDHKIKTIIDFRIGDVQTELNPADFSDIKKEQVAVEAIPYVNYVQIPSLQVPNEKNLEELYKVLDDESNYPVLMHCHHGFGRAVVYSAVYRMEYEGVSNENARAETRPFYSLPFSSFAKDKPKGAFIEEYKRRNEKQ